VNFQPAISTLRDRKKVNHPLTRDLEVEIVMAKLAASHARLALTAEVVCLDPFFRIDVDADGTLNPKARWARHAR
jgi:hypothetical protein